MTILSLARKEIRELRSYSVSESDSGRVRLNANESPIDMETSKPNGLNRYPSLRPTRLAGELATFYGVDKDNVLVTRGSSEGIDLLMRTFCRAGEDEVLLTPPAFEMYQVYAAIQGAITKNVPLLADNDFAVDQGGLLAAVSEKTKLIFLCSPNNPVGVSIPVEQVVQILTAVQGKSVVVIDEAYIEYSETDSMAALVNEYENLVVLRTLSKAMALAGARCGALLGSPELVALLGRVLAPYAISSPVVASAEKALNSARLQRSMESIQLVIAERERLRVELLRCDLVDQVWPSEANFLFVRFKNLSDVASRLEGANISIRTYGDSAMFTDCARISIGSAAENEQLLDVLRRGH